MQENKNLLDISWNTIFKISLAIICLSLLYSIRDIFVLFVFAVAISILFNPAINFLQKRKIPRFLGGIFVYFSVIGFFALLIYLTIPVFKSEISQFSRSLPSYYGKLSPFLKSLGFKTYQNINEFLSAINNTLQKMSVGIFNIISTVFGGLSSFAFIFATAFFISIEERAIEKTLVLIFPKKYEYHILNLWTEAENKISNWFLAKILCSLFVGFCSFLFLLIFDVKYPALLGLIAGFLNFFPYVGAFVAGLLIFIVVAPVSILKSILVLIIFILIQQIESNLISPFLVKKFMDVSPALVLIFLVVGIKLWGFWGALLAIPLFSVLFEFLKEFLKKKREKENESFG